MLPVLKLLIVFLLTNCIIVDFVTFANGVTTVADLFKENGVVPDVVPVAPNGLAAIQYPNGLEVQTGKKLTPTQVKDIPIVQWDVSPSNYYTIMFVDPDAPSRMYPESRSFLHWLVGNILGTPGSNQTGGETLAEYIGSGPGKGSGLHRYVMLVYKEAGRMMFDEPRLNASSIYGREKFSVVAFADKYNLMQPVAGNFFQAQYDDYVPKLYAQIGISTSDGGESTKIGYLLFSFFLCFYM